MVYSIEVIGLLFAAIMIYLTYLEYKRKLLKKPALIFWILVWIVGIGLIVFHNSINVFLDPLNIIRVLDLYMIFGFFFLFALVFYLFLKVGKTESRLETFTRIVALKELKDFGRK